MVPVHRLLPQASCRTSLSDPPEPCSLLPSNGLFLDLSCWEGNEKMSTEVSRFSEARLTGHIICTDVLLLTVSSSLFNTSPQGPPYRSYTKAQMLLMLKCIINSCWAWGFWALVFPEGMLGLSKQQKRLSLLPLPRDIKQLVNGN